MSGDDASSVNASSVSPSKTQSGVNPPEAALKTSAASQKKVLSPEAQRALAEAQARRVERDRNDKVRQKELGGREGPDPVRYGDWENDGIISDF